MIFLFVWFFFFFGGGGQQTIETKQVCFGQTANYSTYK